MFTVNEHQSISNNIDCIRNTLVFTMSWYRNNTNDVDFTMNTQLASTDIDIIRIPMFFAMREHQHNTNNLEFIIPMHQLQCIGISPNQEMIWNQCGQITIRRLYARWLWRMGPTSDQVWPHLQIIQIVLSSQWIPFSLRWISMHLFFQWIRIRTMQFILVFSNHRWLYDKLASTQYKYYSSHKEYPCLYYESATKPYTIVVFFEWIQSQWISIRSIHLNNANNMVSAMNTIVSTMNQHQSQQVVLVRQWFLCKNTIRGRLQSMYPKAPKN